MNIEEALEKCEISLKQIKQYDPDPFYVNYFFNQFIDSINNLISGIFEEANRDFGLFILKNISEQKWELYNLYCNRSKKVSVPKFRTK